MKRNRTVALIAGLSGIVLALAGTAWAKPSTESASDEQRIKGFFGEGLQRQQEKRYAEAVMVYRRALKLDPHQPEVLNNMGFCYKAMKNYKKAIEYYKQALHLKPDLAEAHEYLGEAYVAIGNLKLAQQEYETLLTLDPEEAEELKGKIDTAASASTHPAAP